MEREDPSRTTRLESCILLIDPRAYLNFTNLNMKNCQQRRMRDNEVNSALYTKLTPGGAVQVTSDKIKVGDLIYIEKVSIFEHDQFQMILLTHLWS